MDEVVVRRQRCEVAAVAHRGGRVGRVEVAVEAAVAEAVVAVDGRAEVGVRGALVGRVRPELDAHQRAFEAVVAAVGERQDLLPAG